MSHVFTSVLSSRQFLRLRRYILPSGLLFVIFYAVLISACYTFRSSMTVIIVQFNIVFVEGTDYEAPSTHWLTPPKQIWISYTCRTVMHTEPGAYRGGGLTPPPLNFRRPTKIVPNSTRLWKLLKIAEFWTPTPQDVRKKGSKILKLPPVRNCFTLAVTNKLVVITNSLKIPKIKRILLYEIKFLVPNYSCLQNPWLGGYRPQIPVLSVLCPQLNLLTPPKKIPGYATAQHWTQPFSDVAIHRLLSKQILPWRHIQRSRHLWTTATVTTHTSKLTRPPIKRLIINLS